MVLDTVNKNISYVKVEPRLLKEETGHGVRRQPRREHGMACVNVLEVGICRR